MRVWRLCRATYADDLTGTGARRFGGRWNSPGLAVLDTASNAALAVLEVRVQLDLPPELVPEDYTMVTIDLAGLEVGACPDGLDATDANTARVFGDAWLRAASAPVLRVPSAIVTESNNLLLNPAHPDAARARVVDRRPFRFDPRLWLPLR